MAETAATPNKRRRDDNPEHVGVDGDAAEARKRMAFLQTMGHQLREFGNERTSPQGHSRTSFGTSPGNRAQPASRTTSTTGNQASNQHLDIPESDAAPGEEEQTNTGATKSASKWLWKSNEVLLSSRNGRMPSFSFEELLDWSQSYFDHWHPAFPFLHAPSLLDYFHDMVESSSLLTEVSAQAVFQNVIVRSIMSISIADRRQMTTPTKILPAALTFYSINDAINSVQLVLTEESSILSLQALVSVQLFLITMHRYNAASRLEGLAVRIAFQLGLHKCPMQSASIPKHEAKLRKRMFWSIFCIDRYVCIRLGNPLGIRLDNTNVCYLHIEQHTSTGEEDQERDTRLDLLEFLARHADIRGSIMEARDHLSMGETSTENDHFMKTEAEHIKWWNVVDEHLSNDEGDQAISKVHQVTLIVLRFESVLALHRSILATSRKGSAYNAALQRCISASRSIINTLHKAIKGFGAFDGSPGQNGYERTPLVWPSFTWAVWMSSFIIIHAATEGQVARDVALRLADRSIQVLRHLALRGTSWPEACIIAIQNLSTRLSTSSTRSSTVAPGGNQVTQVSSHSSAPNSMNSRRMLNAPLDQSGHNQHQLPNQTLQRDRNTTMPMTSFQTSYTHHSHSAPYSFVNESTNIDAFNVLGTAMPSTHLQDNTGFANTRFAGSGTFLGIAQQTSDNPIPNEDIMHLFSSEDTSFWMGSDIEFGRSL